MTYPLLTEQQLGLFTDLYELTMAQAYHVESMDEHARFSLYFRKLPPGRHFILACGQEHVARLATKLRFHRPQLDYLASLGQFSDDFLQWLEGFRFTGEIRTLREGTPVFPHEPLLEVEAPVVEGQLLESLLMNYISTETVLASKAVRMVIAAEGRPVVDFGMRRMHGCDAALRGVRAYRVAGLAATSNVLGSQLYGLPAQGTMAHSYIQAHRDEAEAFRTYARLYPGTTLLVDTYDSLAGVDKVIALARDEGYEIGGIRLDSGDLGDLAQRAREKLDAAGQEYIRIIVSSNLDEWAIQDLVQRGAPVDGFGVGTRLGVAEDAPALDFAYKLTEYGGEPRLKKSPGKKILPGSKQVWRFRNPGGKYSHDEVCCRHEARDGEPLLAVVVADGQSLGPEPDPANGRERVQRALEEMPDNLLSLDGEGARYEVRVSPALEALHRRALKECTGEDGDEW